MVAVPYYYLVAQNNTHLLAYRSIVQKPKMGFTGPQSSCGQSCIHSFPEVLGQNLFPGLFQLLEAACNLGSWPLPSSQSAAAGLVFLTLNPSMPLLPPSSTLTGAEFVC